MFTDIAYWRAGALADLLHDRARPPATAATPGVVRILLPLWPSGKGISDHDTSADNYKHWLAPERCQHWIACCGVAICHCEMIDLDCMTTSVKMKSAEKS